MVMLSTMFMLAKYASQTGVSLTEIMFWRQVITLPMLIGIQKTGWIACLFALAGIGTSFLPYLTWGREYLALIGLPDLLILAGALQGLRAGDSTTLRDGRATLLLKGGMFTALAAFTISALLL